MKKTLNKLKNNQLLNNEDLIKILKELKKEKKLTFDIVEDTYPYYDFYYDNIGVSSNMLSDWFCDDASEMYMKKYIQPFMYVNESKEIKELTPNQKNLILIGSLFHELRHAEQQKILKNKEIIDTEFAKNMIVSNIHKSMFKNNLYHDYLYHEYDADLNGAIELNKFNERFLELDEIGFYNEYAAYKIMRGYVDRRKPEISCPIKNNEKINGKFEELFTKKYYIKDYLKVFNKLTNTPLPYFYKEFYNELLKREEYVPNDFKSRLLRGDELENKEIDIIKDIYLGKRKDTKILFK